MEITRWKVVVGGAAIAGLTAGGIMGAAAASDDGIDLRDRRPPIALTAHDGGVDDSPGNVIASADSPNRSTQKPAGSPFDAPDDGSVDPAPASVGAPDDDPAAAPDDTPDSPDTPDTPDSPPSPDTPDTPDSPDSPPSPDTPDTPDDEG